jgi:hypothetical protein
MAGENFFAPQHQHRTHPVLRELELGRLGGLLGALGLVDPLGVLLMVRDGEGDQAHVVRHPDVQSSGSFELRVLRRRQLDR